VSPSNDFNLRGYYAEREVAVAGAAYAAFALDHDEVVHPGFRLEGEWVRSIADEVRRDLFN